MSHTQTKELNKIQLGSMDFYVIPFTGSVPADNVIETESNMIGRTKNGATVTYQATWVAVSSDDGKAKKRKLTGESATIGYGNITWNANTLAKLIATASVTEADGKRTAKIGGVANDNGIRYLIRGVHHDATDGDIRITGVGVNTGGWEFTPQPDNPSVLNPTFELDPIDNDGRLLIYEEEIIAQNGGITLDTSALTITVGSSAVLTATTVPAGGTVTWATSDSTKATVSSGTVTGAAAGSTNITASVTVSGVTYSAVCAVTVVSGG